MADWIVGGFGLQGLWGAYNSAMKKGLGIKFLSVWLFCSILNHDDILAGKGGKGKEKMQK